MRRRPPGSTRTGTLFPDPTLCRAAYGRAWFCANPQGHIQAIGYDEKGRKQYRYHPDFRARQEADKFDRCAGFGCWLPKLRARVERGLKQPGIGRHKAMAAAIGIAPCREGGWRDVSITVVA